MWFEERSWSNLRVSELVEEWRDLWGHKVDFLFAVISYVCATTNLLNLPKLILENGGVAFVCAYAASVLGLALPTIILELAVGQLTGKAPVAAFYSLSPAFKGIGVSQLLFTMLVLACMTRFLAMLGLFGYNLLLSIYQGREGLPWLNCSGFPEIIAQPCREAGSIANFSSNASKMSAVRAESTLMQFMSHYENPSQSIDAFGEFRYWLLGAQGIIWILVFIGISGGVRTVGKVLYLTFTVGLAVVCTLLVRSLTFEGLSEILDVYWKATDWERLADYNVWKIAVEQAILATGIGFGVFITMGSYNRRSNNLVGDSFLVVICHFIVTAMQVAIVVGFVGFVSIKTGLQPMDLLDKGESQMWHILSYMAYTSPTMKLWSGFIILSTIVVLLNIFILLSFSVLSTMEDALGDKWSRCCLRFILAFFVCGTIFGMSLYFATQAGRHAYELVTGFMKYITIFVILTFELFATAWFYCAHRLGMDLHTMLRTACCWCLGHFILLFTYLLPVLPAAVAVLNALSYDFSSFSPAIHHWQWSEYVGAACAVVPLLPIPFFFFGAVFKACCCADKAGHSRGQRLKQAITSGLRRDKEKMAPPPRYTGSAPGYLLLPQAPLAEPETYA